MSLGRKHRYQAWLVPYAEGTLDAARAARLEAHLARDPALAVEAERVRAVTAHLHWAAAQNGAEADPRLALDPAPLWPGVQRRLAAKPRRLLRPARWAAGVCAAGLAVGALLLHGPLSGIGTRQTPPDASTRVADADGAADPVPETQSHSRRKKTGRRIHARPTYLAFSTSRPLPPARLAARPLLPSSEPAAPAPPLLLPAPAVPSARTAVALGGGSGHFRLASPVPEVPPAPSPRPASGTPADRASEDAPAPDKPAPTARAAQTQNVLALPQDTPASAPAAPSAPLPAHARKTHRHRLRRRHHSRRPAALPADPATKASPATPDAVPPGSHNSRAI